jgi:hypothetical protein
LLLLVLLGCRRTYDYSVVHPETGNSFPTISEIVAIRVINAHVGDGPKLPDFDAPKEIWPEIMASLTPSQADREPLPWEFIAGLEIKAKHGNLCVVSVYNTSPQPVGAFDIELGADKFARYRGGNTTEIKKAITAAYAEFRKNAREKGERQR